MNTDEFYEKRSAELERRYVAGDYRALVEVILQFSDHDEASSHARPLPGWAWRAAVEHLKVRFEMPVSGRRGRPSPQKETEGFDRRRARWATVSACRVAKNGEFLDLRWVNDRRKANGLRPLGPDVIAEGATVFDFAAAILRGTPAQAAAMTIREEYYRFRRDNPDDC